MSLKIKQVTLTYNFLFLVQLDEICKRIICQNQHLLCLIKQLIQQYQYIAKYMPFDWNQVLKQIISKSEIVVIVNQNHNLKKTRFNSQNSKINSIIYLSYQKTTQNFNISRIQDQKICHSIISNKVVSVMKKKKRKFQGSIFHYYELSKFSRYFNIIQGQYNNKNRENQSFYS
ncbi:unnamed protein product [Paramecium sonneborni]|uniref:Uncharacterized protein n=1 Tax=Paramecium sonneborni TaxID=65129 RepID=A0A8S1KQR0_9CILI|nr:unnamed protein product [Paramecium sonneborni]